MGFWSAIVSWFCVTFTSKKWFQKQSKWPWNMIHLMTFRNPCRLCIHLAFTYFIRPSSELGPAPPYPPMRVLEVQWLHALSHVWEMANRWSSFTSNSIALGRGLGCSTNIHSIHSGQLWIPEFFFFFFFQSGYVPCMFSVVIGTWHGFHNPCGYWRMWAMPPNLSMVCCTQVVGIPKHGTWLRRHIMALAWPMGTLE